MIGGSIARRYAKALHELSAEAGTVEETGAALGEFAAAVSALGERTLAPGSLDRDARQQLGRALADSVGATSVLGRFLQVVALRDRIAMLPGVHACFVKIQDGAAGRVRMAITTAAELSEDDHAALLTAFAKLAGSDVVAESHVEPDLIGGAVVEIGGRVYDASIKTRIARLAARMAGEAW